MQTRNLATLALGLVLPLAAVANRAAESPGRLWYGPAAPLGGGTARSYLALDQAGAPQAVGVELSAEALTELAPRMNRTSRCFDRDGSGALTHGECLGDYQLNLGLPDEARAKGVPFRWIGLNWNPEGHLEPAPRVWSAPHFDFHFYLVPPEVIQAIRPGPCAELIDCDEFRTAQVPLPPAHQPPDYIDVGAAVPAMGNHLIDRHDPELADSTLPFTRTFIFGSYGGRLIFLEPMVSLRYLLGQPAECAPVRLPVEVEIEGYYPTSYCVRYDRKAATYRVSLEGLLFRKAGPGT
jgi:hypothetical protein